MHFHTENTCENDHEYFSFKKKKVFSGKYVSCDTLFLYKEGSEPLHCCLGPWFA